MARRFLIPLDGANSNSLGTDIDGYGGLFLVGVIVASLAMLSMIIFACGHGQDNEGSSKKKKRNRYPPEYYVFYNNYAAAAASDTGGYNGGHHGGDGGSYGGGCGGGGN